MIAPLAKLPMELRPIVAALWTQPKFFDAIVGQAEALPQSAAQVAATGDYGDIPLVVLSANSASPSQMKEHESWRTCFHSGRGRVPPSPITSRVPSPLAAYRMPACHGRRTDCLPLRPLASTYARCDHRRRRNTHPILAS